MSPRQIGQWRLAVTRVGVVYTCRQQPAASSGAGGIPGQGDDRSNRLTGPGALAGIMAGTAVGVAAVFARPVLNRVPSPVNTVMPGALAMAGSAARWSRSALPAPVTGPRTTGASDIVPHLGYGVAAYATLTALGASGRGRKRLSGRPVCARLRGHVDAEPPAASQCPRSVAISCALLIEERPLIPISRARWRRSFLVQSS